MRKKIAAAVAFLFAIALAVALAACGETFSVSVDCGPNGSYVLSPQKETYEKGEEVTLRVTPAEGYETKSVTVNGSEVELQGGEYPFTVEENTEIELRFEAKKASETYRVEVRADEGGTYSLSPQKETYKRGEEVTLRVAADEGYRTKSVKVNGTEVGTQDGEYPFTVEGDTEIAIGFKKDVSPSKYLGVWRTRQAPGTLGSEIRISESEFILDGTPCTVTKDGEVYSFSLTDEEGVLWQYTAELEAVLGGEIVVLTMRQTVPGGDPSGEEFTAVYYRDGADYIADVVFDERLIGFWEQIGGKSYGDVEITENEVLVTSSGGIVSHVIKRYDAAALTIVLANGDELRYADDRIALYPAAGGILNYKRGAAEAEQRFPELAGVYAPKNYSHVVVIDDAGEVFLDGTKYRATALDPVNMPNQYMLANTYHLNTGGDGEMLWLYGGEIGDDTVVFNRMESGKASVTVGDIAHGSYTLSKEAPYAVGEAVTITLSADADYEVQTFTLNGTSCLPLLEDGSYTFYVADEIAIAVTLKLVKYYTVNVTCGDGGSYAITPEATGGRIPEKTTATIKVTPDDGYELVSFKVNGTESMGDMKAGGEYEFTADAFTAKNGTISFEIAFETETEFIPAAYLGLFRGGSKDGPQLDIMIEGDGTLRFYGGYTDTVTLSKIGRGLYAFTRSSGNTGKLLLNGDGTVTTSGAAVISVKAANKVETHSVGVQCGTGGSVTVSFGYYTAWDYRDDRHLSYQNKAAGPYGENDTVKLTIVAESGYAIESIRVNGVEMKAELNENGEYVFTVTQDTEIEITFTPTAAE